MDRIKLMLVRALTWVLQIRNEIRVKRAQCTTGFWNGKFRSIVKWIWYMARTIISIVVFIFILMYGIPAFTEFLIVSGNNAGSTDATLRKKHVEIEKMLSRDIAQLEKRMQTFTPKFPYIIINTTDNKFYVYNGSTLLREGKCSTGSYINLVSENKKSWVFKTPRGERRIRGKLTSPVWRKPDWAFIEEGIPIPPAFHNSRYEYGVLGDYALAIGDGYLIHGTIYKRQLGMPVTHGCVRLNDEDLKYVYHALEVGSRVFIY